MLLALAAAQGIAVALFALERIEALRHAHRDDAVQRTATVARLLAGTPPTLHEAVIEAASTELVRFSLTGDPVVGMAGAGERASASADDLSAALDEMQRMTEDALAFIREDMQREETRTVDLHALLDSVAADLTELGHDIAVAETGRVLVSCRAAALRRAFRNLLENAACHGGRAFARIEGDDEGLRIVVEDEGPGIPESELERVFEPFVRLEASRSRETGGSGLGLVSPGFRFSCLMKVRTRSEPAGSGPPQSQLLQSARGQMERSTAALASRLGRQRPPS